MARIDTISNEAANAKTQEYYASVNQKLGMVPNMVKAMANSQPVLEGYLQLSGAVGKGKLSARVREQISLAVAEANHCEYCLAAHTAVGKMLGLSEDQIRDSRLGTSVDPKQDALLHFANKVVAQRGQVSDADLQEVRDAGFDDGAISEIVANVALNIFTNYFNNVGQTEVDFPAAPALNVESATA